MQTLDKNTATSANLMATSDLPVEANIKCKLESPSTNSDRRHLNLRELNESDRTTMIQDTVEKAVSLESRRTVESLLTQVRQLSPIEKLLLYLKLPNGRSPVDPLRQNLNPLGSRLEIHHTITWIKTHLQEDPEVSLPKQDVYEQYLDFCQVNSIKPLSTADFGKVMKQVYPNVRPRRLGTRGHSRYCYAGLRKRMRLAPPLLPDLGPSEKTALEDCNGGKAGSPERTMLVAVSTLIREWAGKSLGLRFGSLQDLACHLVQSMSVNVQSTAALTVLSAFNSPAPRSGGPSRPTSSAASLGSEGRPPSSCSAGPSRPASETPRSSIEREHKRKIQEDLLRPRLKSNDNKMRGKRTKHRSSSSPLDANISGGPHSALSKTGTSISNQNCDKATGGHTFCGVPYANTKHGQADVQNNNTMLSNGSAVDIPAAPLYSNSMVPDAAESILTMNHEPTTENYLASQCKLPIPRLPKPNSKQAVPNYMNVPFSSPCLGQPQHQSPVTGQKQKYKPIKPKPSLEEVGIKIDGDPSKPLANTSDQNGVLKGVMLPQKGANNAIIGCLEKDALDDYLHGGSNSQEQEEELMQYFPQQSQQSQNHSMQVDSSNGLDKISQLRLLLEKNMNQDMAGKTPQYQNGLSAAASLSLMSQQRQQKQGLIPPSFLSYQQYNTRRVSFEVPVDSDSVPPSPSTKQRFSFTPISPRPYSPTKSSSTNASPFVSPRNTPIPRRMSTQPTTTLMHSVPSSVFQGKTGQKGYIPRTIMRSMSVNSEAYPMSPYEAASNSPFISSMRPTDFQPTSMDVKPDINSLQELGHATNTQNNNLQSTWNSTSQSLTTALTPLQLPRNQYQVSMSAPQSPVVPCSKSMKKGTVFAYSNKESLRKETRAHSFDLDSTHLQPTVEFKHHPDSFCHTGHHVPNFPDKYSQEVSELFPEDEALLSSMASMSSFRSQSVPLRRMANSVAVSPMPATALPSPHYGPPPTQQGFFSFNQIIPGSSVAPTPVPSEMADFGADNDVMHPSAGGLIQLIREDMVECNSSNADGMTTEGLNSDILNEMMNIFEGGKNDAQQQPQDFPQTPELYKPDPETTLRGDPLFSSFRLQTVGSECGSCSEEQMSLSGAQSSASSSANPILNELNTITNDVVAQPGMESLLEEAPSSFMTEDLECELSQLTREVGNSSSQ